MNKKIYAKMLILAKNKFKEKNYTIQITKWLDGDYQILVFKIHNVFLDLNDINNSTTYKEHIVYNSVYGTINYFIIYELFPNLTFNNELLGV